MNKKTAIIVGVIILLLTSIITPILLRKIESKANIVSPDNNAEETQEIEKEQLDLSNEEIVDNTNVSSGETISNEEQTGSGEKVEEEIETMPVKAQENNVATTIKATNKTQTATSQGATNQTQPAETETNNVPQNVEVTSEEIQNAVVIDVATIDETMQVIEEQPVLAEEEIFVGQVKQSNISIPEGMVGVLKIDKMGLYQQVADGHSLDVLKSNLGHVDSTAYSTGNVGILGHNSGNAGYFQNLWDLKQDDVIEYTTTEGVKTYKVSEVVQIADDDWSKLANTKDNRITLITCVKGVPEKRWCIQAVEI